MRQKEGADCQWPTLGKRDTDRFSSLFSGFSLLDIFIFFLIIFFIVEHPFVHNLSLSFLLLFLSHSAVFVLLSYIQTCYSLNLSSLFSRMAT